jgi:hypothetical protein
MQFPGRLALVLLALTAARCDSRAPLGSGDDGGGGARIVSAFFGLDDALPLQANLLCPGGGGEDGMPIVLSRRVALEGTNPRLSASSFRVTRADGRVGTVRCATLAPAVEAPERHTVLLIGDLGAHPGNPPARVEIVGSVPLEGGGDALGAVTTRIVPLPDGPSLVLAERFDPTTLPRGGAGDCPDAARAGVVRVAWNGGVTPAGGGEVGETQRRAITVTLRDVGGVERRESLAALGDTNDNDNYLELCLATTDRAVRVEVSAGVFVDPNNDANEAQRLDVP